MQTATATASAALFPHGHCLDPHIEHSHQTPPRMWAKDGLLGFFDGVCVIACFPNQLNPCSAAKCRLFLSRCLLKYIFYSFLNSSALRKICQTANTRVPLPAWMSFMHLCAWDIKFQCLFSSLEFSCPKAIPFSLPLYFLAFKLQLTEDKAWYCGPGRAAF